MVKPKLNSYVWVAYKDFYSLTSFTKVKVIAKGTNLFIHEGCIDDCKMDSFRRPVYYNETWFKSLKEIRKKYKIKKVYNDYYEVEIEWLKN